MIVKSDGGFQVKSEGGKNLSKPGMSKAAAHKRLAQVEFFKHKGKRGRRPKSRPALKGTGY